ncbi:hypothetical protein [Novosphingobium sp. PC22D]|uniref:hypothetical protein n=1 Tax=Novosphingobium sp. PC22D TaxID=1962403 RepID=UPI001145B07B|nr:hypothetical protein [Novosphingobium sp. PC22D]
MNNRIFTIMACSALITACSNSPDAMLKKGDPKVCASDEILEQVYSIVKDNALYPTNVNISPAEYESSKQGWISKLKLSADNVTSSSVDTGNQKISCSGTLTLSAADIGETVSAPLEFEVQANQSDQRKPIIVVNMGPIQGHIFSILTSIAKPDFDAAQDKLDAQEDALVKQDEDLVRDTPGATEKLQARSRENLVANLFSEQELALIDRIYLSHMMCMSTDARNRDAFCRKERRLNKEAKEADLCSTAGNEWYHCSKEAELQQQRDALQQPENATPSNSSE